MCIRQRIGVRIPSPPYSRQELVRKYGLFLYSLRKGDENPRPGFDNWRQPVGQTASAANRLPAQNAGSVFEQRLRWPQRARPMDGPSNGERSESIPSPPYSRQELVRKYGLFLYSLRKGDENLEPLRSLCRVALRLPDLQKLLFNHPCILFCKKIHQRPDGRQ